MCRLFLLSEQEPALHMNGASRSMSVRQADLLLSEQESLSHIDIYGT